MKRLAKLLLQKLYPQALKASVSLQNPLLTSSIFAQFLKSNSILSPFLSTSLITHFSISGCLPFAAFLLRLTRKPDTAVFNSLISAYARVFRTGPAFELFNELCQLGLNPDVYSLSGLIKSCGDLGENEIAHGVSIKLGLNSNGFSASGLIENYSKLGFVESAERCFGECLDLDAVVLTAMINAYVSNGELEKGRGIFMQMRCLGLCLNEYSLTSVIGALFDVKEGEQIHGLSLKFGFLSGCSIHLNNAVMNMYCRLGGKFDAVKVFDEIPKPDIISWTGLIGATDDVVEAFEIFELCRFNGLEINEYTLSNVLSVITNSKILNCGKQIHALCYKLGHLFIVSVCNLLILMYGKCGITHDAKCVFDEMIYRDPVTWNSMIVGYSQNGQYSDAVSVFSQMTEFSVQLNKYTIASILDVVSNSNSQNWTMQMHSLIIKYGFESDDSMLSSLITSYGKCNGIKESMRVFSQIDEPKVSLLNAMSATFLHLNCHFDALELFKNSLSSSFEVDNITFSMALKACGVLTNLELGRAIHSMALKSGFHGDIFVESSIIDAYCKCGVIDEAEIFFRYASKGNLVASNAMLMGYAQRGCYSEVFDLFKKMSELGTWPDEVTYIGVLTSCCNSGLVKEALYYLSSMLKIHNVVPCLEHYACVIDVLGRVGLVEEAKRTIDRMPNCPDAYIWQILLSACCMHGKVDLGIFAGKELIKLQPDNDSAYVLMSNLYASAGMWDDVGSLRKDMKERVIHKEVGSSWIQVKDSTRYFVAGKALDSDNKEILAMVKHLRNEMLQPLDLEQDINVQICSLF